MNQQYTEIMLRLCSESKLSLREDNYKLGYLKGVMDYHNELFKIPQQVNAQSNVKVGGVKKVKMVPKEEK